MKKLINCCVIELTMHSLDDYHLRFERVGIKKRGKMAGTRAGGLKSLEKNKKKFGADYMAKLGSRGGKKAQKLHPELQRFTDKNLARKMQKRSIKARLAKKVEKV